MAMTITHAKSDTIADFTGTITGFNSSGGTATILATNLVRPSDWNSAHVLVEDPVAYFEPFIAANTNSTLSAPGIGTWYFDPFEAPSALGSGQINMLMADAAGFLHGAAYSAASTGSVSRYQTMNNVIALYRLGTGASTTRLESIWSVNASYMVTWERRLSTANTSSGTITNAVTFSFPGQWDASGGVTYSSTAQSGTTAFGASTIASTHANNLITGAVAYLSGSKMAIFPFATSIPAGEYWFAHMVSSTSSSSGTQGGVTSGGTMFSTQSRIAMLEFIGQAYKRFGQSVSNSSTVFEQFHGSLATTTSAPTSILATSDIRNLAANHRVYWNYAQSSY